MALLFWLIFYRSNLVSTGCDRDYIQRWTQELEVVNLWQEVKQ